MLKNMIRIGRISSVKAAEGTVRVVIDDQQDMVTNELPLLSFAYDIPSIGDLVLCVFLGNGISNGFCLGRYFNDGNPPPVTNKNIWAKDFGDGTSIKYNKTTQELTIVAVKDLKINVAGNLTVTVTGDVTVTADGNIKNSAGGSNTDISDTKTTAVTHH
jgi:phage baseplate assembly protein V